ncbi:MAG: hypothetical protein WBA46_12180 [Thermomicrobiales bacterium]
MSDAQRDHLEAHRRAHVAIDAVTARFADRLTSILSRYAGRPMTLADRRMAMQEIDRLIAQVYGPTQAGALASELYRAILDQAGQAAMIPYSRVVHQVQAIATTFDPLLWARVGSMASPTSPDPFVRVVSAIDGNPVARQRILNSRRLDPQRRWVKAQESASDRYRLSDRVWRLGRSTRKAIDARIREGIRSGEDALSIAADLETFLKPAMQPETLRADGKIIRRRNQTLAPGRGGWGCYPARRLARTEVTRVLGASTVSSAEDVIGVRGVGWRLSARHPEPDVCDEHARADPDGLGAGVYGPRNVPAYPPHPMCLCTVSHVMEDRATVLRMLIDRYASDLAREEAA